MALYHYTTGLPKTFEAPTDRIELIYTKHALAAALDDKHGAFRLPKSITQSRFKVIEVETRGEEVYKIVLRGSLDNERDLCVALVPAERVVKTVWLSDKNDWHTTLDASRYTKVD